MTGYGKGSGQIYHGNQFWPDEMTGGLEERTLGERTVAFYQNTSSSLYDSLRETEQRNPEKCCIVDDTGTAYTYRRFLEMTDDFAELLSQRYHVKPGMHIGVLLYNSIEFCVSVYAINKLHAVVVPFSTKYRKPEIFSLMERAGLSGILFHMDFYEWFSDSFRELFHIGMEHGEVKISECPEKEESESGKTNAQDMDRLEETAVLMFTSGTTSRSKGVLMTNFNVMHAITVYQKIFHITAEDKTVIPVPAYHVTGLIGLLGLFVKAGGSIWLHKFFDAKRVLEEVKAQNITFLHGSPTVFSLLLEKQEDFPKLPSLRIFACGSSNMPKRKIEDLKKWLPNVEFRTVYGLTETSSPATIFPKGAAGDSHIGSSGCPVPGMNFKICDENGTILPPGQTGTVLIQGTTVTVGYDIPGNGLTEEGWLDTGDLGYFDADGYLYLVDRKKDMINRGGEKILSFDVENILYAIPGIQEAAVVGIPDERYGEVAAAMVVLAEESDLTEESIRKILCGQLAGFQIPVKIRFVSALPLTANMKVDKRKIREILSREE